MKVKMSIKKFMKAQICLLRLLIGNRVPAFLLAAIYFLSVDPALFALESQHAKGN